MTLVCLIAIATIQATIIRYLKSNISTSRFGVFAHIHLYNLIGEIKPHLLQTPPADFQNQIHNYPSLRRACI